MIFFAANFALNCECDESEPASSDFEDTGEEDREESEESLEEEEEDDEDEDVAADTLFSIVLDATLILGAIILAVRLLGLDELVTDGGTLLPDVMVVWLMDVPVSGSSSESL